MNLDSDSVPNHTNYAGPSCSEPGPAPLVDVRRSEDFAMNGDSTRVPEAETDFAMETNVVPSSRVDEGASETDSLSANQQSTCSSRDIYKFKTDIKLRFKADMSSQTSSSRTSGNEGSAEPLVPTSDASSSSSREEEGGRRLKPPTVPPCGVSDSNGSGSGHSSSASSAYPNSSETSGHGSSVSSSCLVLDHHSPSKLGPQPRFGPPRSESLLPGFVLHISGTHYVPIVVCPGQIEPPMTEETGALPGIYHPISIPVNFGAARFIQSVKMEN